MILISHPITEKIGNLSKGKNDSINQFLKGFFGDKKFTISEAEGSVILMNLGDKCILIDTESKHATVYNLDQSAKLNMMSLSENIWNQTMLNMYGKGGPNKV